MPTAAEIPVLRSRSSGRAAHASLVVESACQVLRAARVLRSKQASLVFRGAEAVAGHTAAYAKLCPSVRPAIVHDAAGAVVAPDGRLFSVMAVTVMNGEITQIDALVDPECLAQLDLTVPPTEDTRK